MYTDYVADETFVRRDNNNLIDPDTAEPNPELTDRSEKALAEIAAAFQKNVDKLSPAQLEQVAGWAKKWKLGKLRLNKESRNDFFMILDRLRNTEEQKKLQRKALRKSIWGGLASAAFVFMLVVVGIVHWGDTGISWGWQAGLIVLLYIAYAYAQTNLQEAILVSKDQDRRYALASLREAKTVCELNEAGLFTYIPHTNYQEPGFNEKKAMKIVRTEVERLTDALYNDPETWLMHHEYPWRNGDVNA